MPKSALVILAPGFEEIEGITVIDILRRAGFEVVAAGLVPGTIVASRGTRHLADIDLSEVVRRDFDIIVLPGGVDGVAHMKIDGRVKAVIEHQIGIGGWVGAICAAPTLLADYGFFSQAAMVCHPASQPRIPADRLRADLRVVVDGKLITSLAAGSAVEFALAIVEQLLGIEAVEKVNQGLCARL
jgi:4-methyl-5(b-hydroxyethyl)-thiazole monophosphate biosynthesis